MTNAEALKSSTAMTPPVRQWPRGARPPEAPQIQTPVGLLNGQMPASYDPDWRKYTNLTPAQIAAFKAMPETCTQVAHDLRHGQVLGHMPKITADMTLAQVQAALDTARSAIAAPFATEATVLGNIGKTVHTQADVEAAFAPAKPAP